MTRAGTRLAQVRGRLQLPVLRRSAGLLEGRHRSLLRGQGIDFDDLSLYSPGDDIGDIDWKSSARAGIPIIRRFVKDSNATCLLLVDTSGAMGARAGGGQTKGEIAVDLAAVVAYLARDRGDPVALIAADASRQIHRPARMSTFDIEATLEALAHAFRPDAPGADIEALVTGATRLFPRRGLAVVITDEAHPTPEQLPSLTRLRLRHDVLVLRIADADPVTADLPGHAQAPVGDVAGTLRLPAYLRDRMDVASHARAVRQQRADAITNQLRAHQIETLIVSSSDEIVPELIRTIGRLRRAHA